MYPYKVFGSLSLYSLLMVVGVVAGMLLIRLQGDRRGLRASLQNLLIVDTVIAVIAGYGSAVLFQAYYNYRATGTFEIVSNTGATFYGGLIGGAAIFIIVYFVGGYLLFPDNYHKRQFRTVADLAAACITAAHGFGRLGCLMAGCCHGRITDAWYGIEMHVPKYPVPVKVIPVQLYEALFLFALTAVLFWLFAKGKKYIMSTYMVTYAVWRFFAEMLRGDYRGATVVKFLSPSQYVSILMLLGGLMLLFLQMYVDASREEKAAPQAASATEETAEELPEAEEVPASEGDPT